MLRFSIFLSFTTLSWVVDIYDCIMEIKIKLKNQINNEIKNNFLTFVDAIAFKVSNFFLRIGLCRIWMVGGSISNYQTHHKKKRKKKQLLISVCLLRKYVHNNYGYSQWRMGQKSKSRNSEKEMDGAKHTVWKFFHLTFLETGMSRKSIRNVEIMFFIYLFILALFLNDYYKNNYTNM